MDIAGQEQPARLGRGGHQLDLGQVRTVVLAMPQLHQPVVVDGVVAIGGGSVEAHPLHRRQRIDLALGVPEVGFQLAPDRQIAEAFQDQGQAVVAELDGPNGLADDGLDGVLEALDPLLDVGLAVVGLGENVGDPDRDQPAVGETLMEGVRREITVEDLGKVELDQKAQKQWDVVDAFVSQLQGGFHASTPGKVSGKALLYRSGRTEGKIHTEKCKYGNNAQSE